MRNRPDMKEALREQALDDYIKGYCPDVWEPPVFRTYECTVCGHTGEFFYCPDCKESKYMRFKAFIDYAESVFWHVS